MSSVGECEYRGYSMGIPSGGMLTCCSFAAFCCVTVICLTRLTLASRFATDQGSLLLTFAAEVDEALVGLAANQVQSPSILAIELGQLLLGLADDQAQLLIDFADDVVEIFSGFDVDEAQLMLIDITVNGVQLLAGLATDQEQRLPDSIRVRHDRAVNDARPCVLADLDAPRPYSRRLLVQLNRSTRRSIANGMPQPCAKLRILCCARLLPPGLQEHSTFGDHHLAFAGCPTIAPFYTHW